MFIIPSKWAPLNKKLHLYGKIEKTTFKKIQILINHRIIYRGRVKAALDGTFHMASKPSTGLGCESSLSCQPPIDVKATLAATTLAIQSLEMLIAGHPVDGPRSI